MIPTVNIIGCGRAARTLVALWQRAGAVRVQQLCNRSLDSARRVATWIGAGQAVDSVACMQTADLWLLGVPDDQLADVAERLAGSGRVRKGDGVFHLSGFATSDLLAPLAAHGARIGSVHPVRSFADPELAMQQFAGTPCGVEGAATLKPRLRSLFAAIGGECFDLSAAQKPLYHAGSVFAANFLVVLQDVAQRAYREAGLSPVMAERLSLALGRGALDNVQAVGPQRALTGPAARGDLETVARQHRAVQQWHDEAGQAYRALSALAVQLGRDKGPR